MYRRPCSKDEFDLEIARVSLVFVHGEISVVILKCTVYVYLKFMFRVDHRRRDGLLASLRDKYYWKGMFQDVTKVVSFSKT